MNSHIFDSVTSSVVTNTHQSPELEQARAEDFLLANYVRTGKRYCHINRPSEPLSAEELLQAVQMLLRVNFPGHTVTARLLRAALKAVTDLDGDDPSRLLPVWGGSVVSVPGTPDRVIKSDTGTVVLNNWVTPKYRTVAEASEEIGPFVEFFRAVFPDREERIMVLDWLSWGLQHEGSRPIWGVMLYSALKGTGKSTFALICRKLFGMENSVVLNGVGQLTQKFNGTALLSKFVNCEEVDIPAKGNQANRLKMLFTDDDTVLEAKGREMERVPLISNFLFTSNHVPHFLPELDRRLYVVDVSHEGHASGSDAREFTALIGRVREALEDEARIAGLYRYLMRRAVRPSFNPRSLNTATQATPIMRRILNSGEADQQQLRDYLDGEQINAIPLEALHAYNRRSLRLTSTQIQALMLQLNWTQQKAKRDGASFSRAIWVRKGWMVDRGQLSGPKGAQEALKAHLSKFDLY